MRLRIFKSTLKRELQRMPKQSSRRIAQLRTIRHEPAGGGPGGNSIEGMGARAALSIQSAAPYTPASLNSNGSKPIFNAGELGWR
jgi:hypothetical protein